MQDFVVFRLYGPMASWGKAAVGGDRPTGPQPTRSAVIGLIAAALGIKRDQSQSLLDLGQQLQIAVKQVSSGSLLRDYHTVQTPSQRKGAVLSTRKRELEEAKINTVLSNRDYRCDGLWTIAVSNCGSEVIELANIQSALQRPVFHLYLGRKSCPLAAPLSPQLVSANSFRDALDTRFPPFTRSEKEDRFWLGAGNSVTYFWEGDVSALPSDDGGRYTTRPWDDPLDRNRWQFGQRVLHQVTVQEEM